MKPHDCYDVAKVGFHEGPETPSTSADNMKPWSAGIGIDIIQFQTFFFKKFFSYLFSNISFFLSLHFMLLRFGSPHASMAERYENRACRAPDDFLLIVKNKIRDHQLSSSSWSLHITYFCGTISWMPYLFWKLIYSNEKVYCV